MEKGDQEYVPLYEGKMVQMYDHRAAGIKIHPENVHRPAQPEETTPEQHQDPKWLPDPQFWIDLRLVTEVYDGRWAILFKEITAPTNARTVLASLAPAVGFGNKVPILIPNNETNGKSYKQWAPLVCANMNSIPFDFVARQKIHGQTINLYLLEQLPFITPNEFEKLVGDQTVAEFIRSEVLHLTYTAVDMQPFAKDMGFDGEPIVWDEEDRRHRIARLDALFFHLYDIDRKDADYILEQFPIVREQDIKTFRSFRTKELILAYMNAIAAGDTTTTVNI